MAGKHKKEDKKAIKDNGARWSLKGMLSGASQVRHQKKDDKVSRSDSQQRIHTTPVFQSEDDAPLFPTQLPIAESYTRERFHAGTSNESTGLYHSNSNPPYPLSNEIDLNLVNSQTHVLQAQIDPDNHHPSVSPPLPANSPPSPDIEYDHPFADPTNVFKSVNEVANTEIPPESSQQPAGQQRPAFELSGDGVKPKASELGTGSRDTTPVELATTRTMQSHMGVRGGGFAEMSSTPRPPPATLTTHSSHGSTQPNPGRHGGPDSRQPTVNSGHSTSQNTSMALQAATLAAGTMPRKALSSGPPTGLREAHQPNGPSPSRLRSESGNSMTTNIPPVIPKQYPDSGMGNAHLDLESDPEEAIEEQNEEDQNSLLKHPTTGHRELPQDQKSVEENEETGHRRRLHFPSRKRDSEKKGALRKTAPQNSATNDWSAADQKRLGAFLKDHKVPKKPYLDQLSTLLEWVPMKLADADAEVRTRDKELNRRDITNKQQKDEIIRLRAELASKERSEQKILNDWVKADNQLKKGSGETSRLRADLERSEKYAQQVQSKLEEMGQDLGTVVRERDKARLECNQYWEQCKKKDQEYQTWHENEMTRVQGEHASEMMAAQDQAQQEKDQLNGRIAHMSKLHREEVTQMRQTHQEEIESRDTAMEVLEATCNAQLRQLTDDHTAVLNQLEEQHNAQVEGVTTQLQGKVDSLKRHMANYSNRGDYTAISDDDFRSNFQLLARRINNLISWVPRPATVSFDRDLDPNGFFARNAQQGGRNWPKFVRNICWRAIVRGFYIRQLGFGAFGREGGEGFDLLDQLHQLFAVPDPQDPSGPCVILPNTKPTNTWRAAFFEALLKGIRQGTAGQLDNRYIRLFHANVEDVTDDIVSSLQRVSENRLDPRARSEIAAFVEGLGTLALEMGSQRAHLYLETCDYGENLLSGERFKDDGEARAGNLTVDLMTQPCIRRVGDGREDLTVQRVIVKGDFVCLKTGY
ncbi:Fc.00g111450.m01.CDS01 [Cosmosporella sp. VM-42]